MGPSTITITHIQQCRLLCGHVPHTYSTVHALTHTLHLRVREYRLDHLVQIEGNTGPRQGDLLNRLIYTQTHTLCVCLSLSY